MGSQNLCQQRELQQLGFERCLPGWMRGASSIKRLPEGGNAGQSGRKEVNEPAIDAVLKTVSLPDPQSLPSFVDLQIIRRCQAFNHSTNNCWHPTLKNSRSAAVFGWSHELCDSQSTSTLHDLWDLGDCLWRWLPDEMGVELMENCWSVN